MSFVTGSSSGRGGYAPRRGRGGRSRPLVKRQEPVIPDLNKNPLGDLVLTLWKLDLNPPQTDLFSSPCIDNCQYITSYNWMTGKDSAILVPGQPPQWTPLKVHRRLPEDSGTYYRDPNAARYPEYPIAPAVQAVLDATEDVPTDIDVFACGSTLGNLLRFTRGMEKAFRFTVESIGDTVFLVRKENDPKEVIDGIHGFGHSFPDAYTTWPKEVKGSETHQRIVQYNLGGLRCLVRYECDGFFDTPSTADIDQSSGTTALSFAPGEDILSQALAHTTISAPQPGSTGLQSSKASPLTVVHGGKSIAQTSIFDLKTRSGKYKKEINMDDITPQLWIKQIPNFIVAYHDGFGLFQDIQVKDVRPLISDFERANAEAIRRLITLLKKIIDTARSDPGRLLEVYCPGNDRLDIRRQFGDGMQALPTALHDRWEEKCNAGGLALDDGDTGHGASPDCFNDAWSVSSTKSDEEDKDFTACSVDDCGYCGRCTY